MKDFESVNTSECSVTVHAYCDIITWPFARYLLSKHIYVATDINSTMEELLEAVFSVQFMVKVCKEN
jgi:preprotein translocase subunit SecB